MKNPYVRQYYRNLTWMVTWFIVVCLTGLFVYRANHGEKTTQPERNQTPAQGTR
jgi:hypothetical protein